MAKVLVITKPDATNHIVPMATAAALKASNNKLPEGKKWIFKEMDESEVYDEKGNSKIPFIDKDFVKPADAVVMVKDLAEQNSAKDQRIAELEALLAEKNGGGKKEYTDTVPVVVDKIKAAKTVEEVNELIANEDRKGVLDAAAKQLDALQAK